MSTTSTPNRDRAGRQEGPSKPSGQRVTSQPVPRNLNPYMAGRPSIPGGLDNSMFLSAPLTAPPGGRDRPVVDLSESPQQRPRPPPLEFREHTGWTDESSPVVIPTPPGMSDTTRRRESTRLEEPVARPSSVASVRSGRESEASDKSTSLTSRILRREVDPEEVLEDPALLDLVNQYVKGSLGETRLSILSQIDGLLSSELTQDLILQVKDDHDRPCYTLEQATLYRVKELVEEAQKWLDDLSSILPSDPLKPRIRNLIDPNGAIINVLNVSHSPLDMRIVWKELQGRLTRTKGWAKKLIADACQEYAPTPSISSVGWHEMATKAHVPEYVARAHMLHSNALGLIDDPEQKLRLVQGAEIENEFPDSHPYWAHPIDPARLRYNEGRMEDRDVWVLPEGNQPGASAVISRQKGKAKQVNFDEESSDSSHRVLTMLESPGHVERRKSRQSSLHDGFAVLGNRAPERDSERRATRDEEAGRRKSHVFQTKTSLRTTHDPPQWAAQYNADSVGSISGFRANRQRETPPHMTRTPTGLGGSPPSSPSSSSSSRSGPGGGPPPPRNPRGRRTTRSPTPRAPAPSPSTTPRQTNDPLAPRIEPRIKLESLPTWDGEDDTAMTYFAQIFEMASLSELMGQQLGKYLWLRFEHNSRLFSWYSTLPESIKENMKKGHREYVMTIRDLLLGDRWMFNQTQEYAEMKFRQRGHQNELPVDFIRRRIVAGRMLGMVPTINGEVDERAEVDVVKRVLPISWRLTLAAHSVDDVAQLQIMVKNLNDELIMSWKAEHRDSERGNNRGARTWNNRGYGKDSVSARDAEVDKEEDDDADRSLQEDQEVQAVYAGGRVAKQNRVFPYPRRDDVRTMSGRNPPGPCPLCGSPAHWKKECPHKDKVDLKEVRISTSDEVNEMYDTLYETLMTEQNASRYVQGKGDEVGDHLDAKTLPEPASASVNFGSKRAYVEEIEDEYFAKNAASSSAQGIEEKKSPHGANREEASKEFLSTSPVRILELKPLRKFKEGHSAKGVSVLSVRGKLGGPGEEEIDLRLDSCADITLMSREYYQSLKNPPRIRKGSKLRLWQLLDGNARIEGYVEIGVYVKGSDNKWIRAKAEAYLVPNMNVPVLLGEDFQLTYGVSVRRDLDQGSLVTFEGCEETIKAFPVSKKSVVPKLAKSYPAEASFVRSKTTRRERTKRRRRAETEAERKKEVVVKQDVTLDPHSVVQVPVEFEEDSAREWLFERALISSGNQTAVAVPNCLLSTEEPRVPVTNTSGEIIKLKAGTIIGRLQDPMKYFDSPKSLKHLEQMLEHAARMSLLIDAVAVSEEEDEVGTDREAAASSKEGPPSVETTEVEEAEDLLGPKTAELPDPTVYPAERIRDIIDVGELPENLRERAWQMLERRKGAFGFDGRLGHLNARVHIRTEEGLNPIAVPMYGTSPAKRLVIEEQMSKWFAQEVIEPSRSPWSAPVVIAYRNGKPRLCVDYRKLNAKTIPDEFPIPRQSEILAALSGSQVLSSLDALAGFTQLELAEEDREKTAFRTHQGLFQFKRMPFGLRNGPSIFQRTMQSILAPFLWLFCLVYIDDIVVFSKSYEEHIQHLEKVLRAIEEAGITLSPNKCHLFYPSVMLLGHKVSRLGLSTHAEKVRAIVELAAPTKTSQLQHFLGMAVYFSAFIPHYSSMASPLFALLKKGAKWQWGHAEQYAFDQIKKALEEAPVLGHPIQGLPYRLYTDASDVALGCALQQVQGIRVRDLKGTKTHEKLAKAFEEKKDIPNLVVKLPNEGRESKTQQTWAETLEETEVQVERVIGYWSRTFRAAEKNYSTTEREALAAKEGLVRFQPFIEGEQVTLVTDHSALQWANTYENANRRLATWGAVFSAYKPGLVICHRPGRVHSNVDPLSRLPRDRDTGLVRMNPEHCSPLRDETTAIAPEGLKLEGGKPLFDYEKKETFFACQGDDDVFETPSVLAVTRAAAQRARQSTEGEIKESVRTARPRGETRKRKSGKVSGPLTEDGEPPKLESQEEELDEEEDNQWSRLEKWKEENEPPPILIHMDEQKVREFVEGYKKDYTLVNRWNDARSDPDNWYAGRRYFKDHRGLLFFKDADFKARLCVPSSLKTSVLKCAHESPFETAHAGAEKLYARLSEVFYWHRMRKDI